MESLVLFGRNVRSIREAAGRTREMVAEDAAITPNYLGEIERGEKWPSLDVIVSLSKSLSMSPAAFFEFEAEDSDPRIIREKLIRILQDRDSDQLQQALRVLIAVLHS
jgi:XRE family transcriptional regulator, regulator of sulfur utilization